MAVHGGMKRRCFPKSLIRESIGSKHLGQRHDSSTGVVAQPTSLSKRFLPIEKPSNCVLYRKSFA